MSKLIFLILLLHLSENSVWCNLDIIAEWQQLDFKFPSFAERDAALKDGRFVETNSIPFDVDVDPGVIKNNYVRRVFVSIPRLKSGVPITLGVVSNVISPNGPLIEPYPDYSWHSSNGNNCNGITSVFRMKIDKCRRLWVLDTGKVANITRCNPQLLAFDLATDQLVTRYRIPANQWNASSLFMTPITDISHKTCSKGKVYMADTNTSALVVFDVENFRSWRVSNSFLSPNPAYSNITINSITYPIVGMSLSPPKLGLLKKGPERLLYFHTYSSDRENAVPLRILNDEASFNNNASSFDFSFKSLGNLASQSAVEAMDSYKNIFYGLENTGEIACWDSSTTFNRVAFKSVIRDPNSLQFMSGMKVVKGFVKKEELWVLSNRMQRFLAGTMNWNEVNFRIMSNRIRVLLNGKKCGSTSFGKF